MGQLGKLKAVQGIDWLKTSLNSNFGQGVLGNSLVQGVNLALDNQKDGFNWAALAAASFTSQVPFGDIRARSVTGQASLDRATGAFNGLDFGATFVRSSASALLNRSIEVGLSRKGKIDFAMIAADAFGNALGNSIVGAIQYGEQERQKWDDLKQNAGKLGLDEASVAAAQQSGLYSPDEFAREQYDRLVQTGPVQGYRDENGNFVSFESDAQLAGASYAPGGSGGTLTFDGSVGSEYGAQLPRDLAAMNSDLDYEFEQLNQALDARDAAAFESIGGPGLFSDALEAPVPIDNLTLGSALRDTGRAAVNIGINFIEGLPNLIGGLALPGGSDYLPFMQDYRMAYDTPAFGTTLEILGSFGAIKALSGLTGRTPVAGPIDGAVGSQNRGLTFVLENSAKSVKAQAYEDSLIGTTYDIATRRRISPALRFDNPNPAGKPFVKYDGLDPEDSLTLIDRKLNVTTRSKQISDVQRWGEALRQNPGYRVRIEVPSANAYRNAIRLIDRAGLQSAPIDLKIVP